jgi:putative DNA primase/helicase
MIVYLPSIPEDRRRPEKEFWSEFQKVQPYILGALLTAITDALANIQHVKLERLPRMADFAQ